MISRLYYVNGWIEKRTTIEELSRLENNLRKYGVDTCDGAAFYLDFEGNIDVANLLYEQLESVLRTFWNLRVRVNEVGEQVYNEETDELEDYVIFRKDGDKYPAFPDIWARVEDYSTGKIPFEEEEEEDEEDEDDED